MYTSINDFNIPIYNNTLVICDIDETIMKFKGVTQKWWDDKYDSYNNLDNKNKICMKIWLNKISKMKPVHTHKESFLNMIQRIKNTNSKLIFLTARPPSLKPLTIAQFDFLNIEYVENQVHYNFNGDKGKYVLNFINYKLFDNVIFIDDRYHNLENMKNALNEKVTCYQFNCFE
tara:strand:+ start:1006 stop:1527 length:522 start_codon:yes stop_codon:yes gene_type:complete